MREMKLVQASDQKIYAVDNATFKSLMQSTESEEEWEILDSNEAIGDVICLHTPDY